MAVAADAGVIPVGHKQRAIRSGAHIDRAKPAIAPGRDQRLDRGGIPGSGDRGRIRAHDVGTGIAVNHFVMKTLRQQTAFVDGDPGRRARTGLQHVGDHARIVEVPVTQRNFSFQVDPLRLPTGSGQFIEVAVVAMLHHEIDPCAAIAVVVVVALPDRTE